MYDTYVHQTVNSPMYDTYDSLEEERQQMLWHSPREPGAAWGKKIALLRATLFCN